VTVKKIVLGRIYFLQVFFFTLPVAGLVRIIELQIMPTIWFSISLHDLHTDSDNLKLLNRFMTTMYLICNSYKIIKKTLRLCMCTDGFYFITGILNSSHKLHEFTLSSILELLMCKRYLIYSLLYVCS
jgi:hypothetical protein